MGSPSSRLFWQILAVAGTPGNCQFGAALSRNGLANASAVSCESAVTSWKPEPNSPGEIQLAYCVTQRGWGVAEGSKKYVWKPSTQHPPGVFGLFTFNEKRNVFGKRVMLSEFVVKLPRLISFTTSLSKKKLNSRFSIRTNVLPSAAVPMKYDRAWMMVPFESRTFTKRGTVMLTLFTTWGISTVCQSLAMRLKNCARWTASAYSMFLPER